MDEYIVTLTDSEGRYVKVKVYWSDEWLAKGKHRDIELVKLAHVMLVPTIERVQSVLEGG